MKSWKTTVAGLGTILAAVGGALTLFFDGKPETNPDWTIVIAAVITGLGLIFARDNNDTSKNAGAK